MRSLIPNKAHKLFLARIDSGQPSKGFELGQVHTGVFQISTRPDDTI